MGGPVAGYSWKLEITFTHNVNRTGRDQECIEEEIVLDIDEMRCMTGPGGVSEWVSHFDLRTTMLVLVDLLLFRLALAYLGHAWARSVIAIAFVPPAEVITVPGRGYR